MAELATALALLTPGCGSDQTLYIGSNSVPRSCAVTPGAPPSSLGLDSFYAKYLDAAGIPILSSGQVSDVALLQACVITSHMLELRADVRNELQVNHQRVAVIGVNEVTTDIPEYSNLPSSGTSGRDWNHERGEGATLQRPVSSAGEENLLCLPSDIYAGESILVETFAYGFHILGLSILDPGFDSRLSAIYAQAIASGLWANTFAATDAGTYFAEGVQDWFDANQQAAVADGTNNFVNTRTELRGYDLALASLLADYFPDDTWRAVCPK